ncbi:Fur family transcriptional regulator [Micromonospora sp. NPDC049679]|uniref:Fur family transcriptional regulator n=1 Tax=Micromonospora sp. NPDC049679 TaxID=3155920 RepID=UPI0034003C34
MTGVTQQRDARALLRAAGMRVTTQRITVLDQVAAHPHSTADALTARVRAALGSVSKQAIYDVLSALTGAGLVRRIEPAGSPAVFESRAGDNHHHLVCRSCGVIVDVDCAVGAAPCLTPADGHGFVVDEAEIVFWGVCPACRIGRESNDEAMENTDD